MTPVSRVSSADLSVVICCYTEERWGDILAAVRSVQLQDHPPGQLVVVVDHNDRLLERLVDALPGVDVVPNAEQRGLAGAKNSGIAASAGAVVAFLDDDATAEPEWTAALLPHYADPTVLGVGGAVRPRWVQSRPGWFPSEFDWVVGCSYTGQPLRPTPVRNLFGGNMSLRREVFETVGRFSYALGRIGKYPAGCEETELCIRAARAFPNGKLIYEPEALIDHRVPPERAGWSYFRRRCQAEGFSKATVTRLVGSGPGLASERAYIREVLPRGVSSGIRAGAAGDATGLARAAMIIFGLCATVVGYAQGHMVAHHAPPSQDMFALPAPGPDRLG